MKKYILNTFLFFLTINLISSQNLDSLYVSMLSEKNKKTLLWPVFGLLVGLASNIVSIFTKNHSSIIYIIK